MIGLIRVQGQAVKGCVRPTIAIFRRLNGATVKIPSEEIIATEHGSCVFVYITDLGRRNSVLWLGDLGRVVVDNGLIVASDFPEALRDACLDGVRAMHAHAPRIAIKDQSVTWTIKTAKHTRSLTLSHAEPSGLWAMIEHQDPADRIVQPNRPPHWFELHLVRKGGWPSWFDWLESFVYLRE